MKKLKTIKDLIKDYDDTQTGNKIADHNVYLFMRNLKQEAIKRVKDRMKVKNGLALVTDTSKLKAEGMINDFIDFFNQCGANFAIRNANTYFNQLVIFKSAIDFSKNGFS